MGKKVVIVTFAGDITGSIPQLQAELASRGVESMRFHTELYPMSAGASFLLDGDREVTRFSCGGQSIELGPDDVIWYRRARWAEALPKTIERQLRQGAILESEAHLRGIIASAPCFVLDPPEQVRRCGHKPWQLSQVRQLGMETPRTLLTGDPDEARAFIATCKRGVIAKMLAAFPVHNEQGEEQVVFTTDITEEHLAKLDGLRYSPMVFQEKIEKAVELRITVIGSKIFCAGVRSQEVEGAKTDWRQRGVTLLESWFEHELPAAVRAQIEGYMERARMQYAAIDMIIEPGGRYVFLEANPAGEFFWMEFNPPRFPMVSTLADVLLDVPGARRVFSSGR